MSTISLEKPVIKKSIDIAAPKEKVYQVLQQDDLTRLWYAAFSKGSRAETDWAVGSKVVFIDNSNSGMIGRVVENIPNTAISVEYDGMVMDGVEDYDSEMVKEFKGGHETYHLVENGSTTRLNITSDMTAEYFETMSAAWDKALQIIKELSERDN